MTPELFLDRKRISWEYNVERRLCRPEKHPGNPVLVREMPWEESFITVYGSVLSKEDGTGFRMWYMSGARGSRSDQLLCYAESSDAFTWQRVMTDEHSYGNHRETNVLLGPDPNIHGPCVLLNEHARNPDEKYLLYYDSYSRYRPDVPEVQSVFRWCYTATSPDGIHWKPRMGRPAVPGKSDTGHSVVWDPVNRRYIAYMRGTTGVHDPFTGPHGETTRIRYVRAAVSDDFVNWSLPVELLRADETDGYPQHQFHQFTVTRRGDTYVGLVSIFHIERYEEKPFEDQEKYCIEVASCDTQLAVSRDGLNWERVADRQIFMPFGPNPGDFDYGFLIHSSHIVFTDDSMLFYYGGRGQKQGEDREWNGGIGVASLPRDRFQAIRPKKTHQAAVLETKPLYLDEGDLEINADARHGRIQVELCDFDGVVIEGFSREECPPVQSDKLNHRIRWKGRKLSDAAGSKGLYCPAVRLRFYLNQAELYAAYLPLRSEWDVPT